MTTPEHDPLPGNEDEPGECTEPSPFSGEWPITSDPGIENAVFTLPSGSVPITDSAASIFPVIAAAKRIFFRGNALVEVVASPDGSHLKSLSAESFRSRLENYGRRLVTWSNRNGSPVLRQDQCSVDTAKALMATLEARALPPICLVSSCPILSPLGAVLGPGYHAQGGGIFVTSTRSPTKPALDEAIASLWELLDDFAFFSPGDRARAMSAILTPALRMGRLIPGRGFAPVDVAEATESQSGKGYRQDLNLAIYGTPCHQTAQRNGGVGSVDESLGAALYSGRSFIRIDNLRGELNSQFFEHFMTSTEMVNVRIPYHGEVGIDARSTTVQLSSNGFEATQDFVNRACFCRIRKQPADYPFKKFPEGDLIDHVRANQPHFLGCVFSVLRAWIAGGRTQTDESRHHFREWVRILDHIVGTIMGAGVGTLMEGHGEATSRTANPSLTWLRSVGLEILRRGDQALEWKTHELVSLAEEADIHFPNGKYGDQNGNQIAGKILSRAFSAAAATNPTSLPIEDLVVTRETRREGVYRDGTLQKTDDVRYYRFAPK